jgi:hypothetical protein
MRKIGINDGRQVVSEIEDLILKDIEQFVFLIVVPWKATTINYQDKILFDPYRNEKSRFERSGYDLEEDKSGQNYKDLFPKPALMSDKKFLTILKNLKDDFDKGCDEYSISLRMLNRL